MLRPELMPYPTMEPATFHTSTTASRVPLVSVITATYNRANYLPLTVQSVLAQTHKHFEYFIVDDGSTDATAEVLAPYLADPRVHYMTVPHRGQSVARNVGLHASKGEFVCFLDSDDLWEPDKLERELDTFCDHPEADIVYGEVRFIDSQGRDLHQRNLPWMQRRSGYITEYLLDENFIPFVGSMIRRRCFEKLGGLDETLSQSDDYELWLRFSTRFRFLPHPGVVSSYRVMHDQISTNKDARFRAIHAILTRFLNQHPNIVPNSVKRVTWCRFYVRRGRYRALLGLRMQAGRDYLIAMLHDPLNIRPWRALLRLVILWQ